MGAKRGCRGRSKAGRASVAGYPNRRANSLRVAIADTNPIEIMSSIIRIYTPPPLFLHLRISHFL
jgi:hypothetical protein